MKNMIGILEASIKGDGAGSCHFPHPQEPTQPCSKELHRCVVAAQPEDGSKGPSETPIDTNGSGPDLVAFVIPHL